MAKPQKRYMCQQCGSVAPRWAGQCGECGEWNCIIEDAGGSVTPFRAKHDLQGGGRALSLSGLNTETPLPQRLVLAGSRSPRQ